MRKISDALCTFTHSVEFYTQCLVLHTVCNLTHSVCGIYAVLLQGKFMQAWKNFQAWKYIIVKKLKIPGMIFD